MFEVCLAFLKLLVLDGIKRHWSPQRRAYVIGLIQRKKVRLREVKNISTYGSSMSVI